MIKNRKMHGFTLAEVLITLTIIGVISAITLPSLNNNVNNTAREKQTLKFYNQLQNMVERYKQDNEVDKIDDDIKSEATIKKYFKIENKCANATDCFASTYAGVNKGTYNLSDMISNGEVFYRLKDGSVFGIYKTGDNFSVTFDTNGKSKPNKVGYDMWLAWITKDGEIVGESSQNDTDETVKAELTKCLNGEAYEGCFSYFLRNGFKIDY